MSDKALQPIEQKQVLFYEDVITVVKTEDNMIYIPIRPLCDFLDVAWQGQRERINRDSVLSTEIKRVSVTLTDSRHQAMPREMLCLPLKFIPGWLFGINASRVNPEIKDKLIRYQRECYDVLAEAFQDGRLTNNTAFDDILQNSSSEAVEAYKLLQAMIKLARNQIMLEAKLENHEQRLETLEAQFGDESRTVTEDQASQISQAVKAIAIELGKRSGRNEYGGVYGELYRKFGVTSYKMLPANQFKKAIKFLTDWYESITGNTPF